MLDQAVLLCLLKHDGHMAFLKISRFSQKFAKRSTSSAHGLSSARPYLWLSALLYATGNLTPLPTFTCLSAFVHFQIWAARLPLCSYHHHRPICSPDGTSGSGETQPQTPASPCPSPHQGMWAPRQYPLATSSDLQVRSPPTKGG